MRHRKRITIQIETSNTAFDNHEGGEISRILRTLCRDLSEDMQPGQNGLYDLNGYTCGQVVIERHDD